MDADGPLWSRVAADLRARIEDGEFADRFPTDRELMDAYDVSRHTVRAAVRGLQDAGVVKRERGRGSYVVAGAFEQPLGALYSLFESIEATGAEQSSRVLVQRLERHSLAAAVLELDDDAELFHLERLRIVDGDPLAHDVVWIPATIGASLVDVDFERRSFYGELRASGSGRPTEGIERIRPVVATRRQSALLGVEPGDPMLEIDRRTRCQGVPLEWRITLIRGDRYSFRAEWSAAEVQPAARIAFDRPAFEAAPVSGPEGGEPPRP